MRFKRMCAMAGAFLFLATLATDALAQRWDRDERREWRDRRDRDRDRGWVELGCRDVGFHVDRDMIHVGRREGRFSAIRLKVHGNRVYMYDLRVIYSNGEPDDLPVRAEIRPGGQTRPIELRGRARSIQRIQMVYQSEPNFRGRATVCVEALE